MSDWGYSDEAPHWLSSTTFIQQVSETEFQLVSISGQSTHAVTQALYERAAAFLYAGGWGMYGADACGRCTTTIFAARKGFDILGALAILDGPNYHLTGIDLAKPGSVKSAIVYSGRRGRIVQHSLHPDALWPNLQQVFNKTWINQPKEWAEITPKAKPKYRWKWQAHRDEIDASWPIREGEYDECVCWGCERRRDDNDMHHRDDHPAAFKAEPYFDIDGNPIKGPRTEQSSAYNWMRPRKERIGVGR